MQRLLRQHDLQRAQIKAKPSRHLNQILDSFSHQPTPRIHPSLPRPLHDPLCQHFER